MKPRKCDATHPTRNIKCWSKTHDEDQSHWAAVIQGGQLQKVEWCSPVDAEQK